MASIRGNQEKYQGIFAKVKCEQWYHLLKSHEYARRILITHGTVLCLLLELFPQQPKILYFPFRVKSSLLHAIGLFLWIKAFSFPPHILSVLCFILPLICSVPR